jgi:1D-myo-inositol-triphosphate 3-kinase
MAAAEREEKAVTKARYMIWRETLSSTSNLGFRIEAIKMSEGTSSKDFKTLKDPTDVSKQIQKFTGFNTSIQTDYLMRLKSLR